MRRLAIVLILCSAALGQNYSTDCSGTENPISEGGNWTNGSAAGGSLWGDVQKGSGRCYGVSQPTLYGDPTATVNGTWGANQTATATVSGSKASGIGEVEVRVRTTISASSINGYELLCSTVSGNAYMQLVRWNGANGSFTYLADYLSGNVAASSNEPILCSPGDTISLSVTGGASDSIFHVYKNGHLLQMNTTPSGVNTTDVTDSTGTAFTSGNPGMGFYSDSTFTGWGFSAWSATGGTGGGSRSIGGGRTVRHKVQ